MCIYCTIWESFYNSVGTKLPLCPAQAQQCSELTCRVPPHKIDPHRAFWARCAVFCTGAHFAAPQTRTGQALALELVGLQASESKQELVKSCGRCSIVSNAPLDRGSAVEHRIMCRVIQGPDPEWPAATSISLAAGALCSSRVRHIAM